MRSSSAPPSPFAVAAGLPGKSPAVRPRRPARQRNLPPKQTAAPGRVFLLWDAARSHAGVMALYGASPVLHVLQTEGKTLRWQKDLDSVCGNSCLITGTEPEPAASPRSASNGPDQRCPTDMERES